MILFLRPFRQFLGSIGFHDSVTAVFYERVLILAENNSKKIRDVLVIILIANWFVAALKITIGMAIQSNSLTADGFHSLSDGMSNIVGLAGIWIASKPVDEDHPYGHKKFETLAGMFIGAMLLGVGAKVVYSAIQNFIHPVTPSVTMESIIAMVFTIGVNIFVSTYENRAGKKYFSQILISDSLHTRSDIFVSIGVLVTLAGLKLGLPPIIDPIASLVVAGFIFHAAYEVFTDTMGVLVDKAMLDKEMIQRIVMEFPEVKDVHRIRSRGREDDIHMDMHIKIDGSITVVDSRDLVLRINARLREAFDREVHAIIHVEPYDPSTSQKTS